MVFRPKRGLGGQGRIYKSASRPPSRTRVPHGGHAKKGVLSCGVVAFGFLGAVAYGLGRGAGVW